MVDNSKKKNLRFNKQYLCILKITNQALQNNKKKNGRRKKPISQIKFMLKREEKINLTLGNFLKLR